MSHAAVLVVSRAPVAGEAKTRLAASVGDRAAADLAAAALLDTLEVCGRSFDTCMVALTGDLDAAERSDGLDEALRGWCVLEQRGDGLGERLANAHADAASRASRAVIQIGMDTPQVTGAQLIELDSMLASGLDAVLGPADDGGWWVLGVSDPRLVADLGSVPMSSPGTAAGTLRLLHAGGAEVGIGDQLRDIDLVEDAVAVAREFPHLRFSAAWWGVHLA